MQIIKQRDFSYMLLAFEVLYNGEVLIKYIIDDVTHLWYH